MRTRITITGLFLLAVATALLNIQQQSSLAFAAGQYKNLLYVGKQDRITDIFELISGILAAILFVLSLRAYTKRHVVVIPLRHVNLKLCRFRINWIEENSKHSYLNRIASWFFECIWYRYNTFGSV